MNETKNLTYDSGETEIYEFFFKKRGFVSSLNSPFTVEDDHTQNTYSL